MNGSQANHHLEASSYLHRAAADSDDVEMATSPNNNPSAEDLDDRHGDADAEVPTEDADDRDVSDISDISDDDNVPHDNFGDNIGVCAVTVSSEAM